mmetsp:Transcript_24428/g.67142  ORF Transcript_24428/g.67142 Transcript_24428/m.67142 type:complete len:226 (+) Transcript_24428:154-831(+)
MGSRPGLQGDDHLRDAWQPAAARSPDEVRLHARYGGPAGRLQLLRRAHRPLDCRARGGEDDLRSRRALRAVLGGGEPCQETLGHAGVEGRTLGRPDPHLCDFKTAGALKPGEALAPLFLEGVDDTFLLQCQANVVEAVDEAVLAEGVDLEGHGLSVLPQDLLLGQVNGELFLCLRVHHQHLYLVLRQSDGKHAVLETIVEKYVREARRDDAADAKVVDGPRRMLA